MSGSSSVCVVMAILDGAQSITKSIWNIFHPLITARMRTYARIPLCCRFHCNVLPSSFYALYMVHFHLYPSMVSIGWKYYCVLLSYVLKQAPNVSFSVLIRTQSITVGMVRQCKLLRSEISDVMLRSMERLFKLFSKESSMHQSFG